MSTDEKNLPELAETITAAINGEMDQVNPFPIEETKLAITESTATEYYDDDGRRNTFTYKGCYRDKKIRDLKYQSRDLGKVFYNNRKGTSILECYKHCKAIRHKYFSLQNGKECYCDDKYGRYGVFKSGVFKGGLFHRGCKSKCPQRTITNCGGSWANSVFQINNSSDLKEPRFSYKGCYKDYSKRDLHKKAYKSNANNKTMCYESCNRKGYKYFGLQYGKECFCSNKFGKYGRIAAKKCNKQCPGNIKCGGKWANSVFKINYYWPAPVTLVNIETVKTMSVKPFLVNTMPVNPESKPEISTTTIKKLYEVKKDDHLNYNVVPSVIKRKAAKVLGGKANKIAHKVRVLNMRVFSQKEGRK